MAVSSYQRLIIYLEERDVLIMTYNLNEKMQLIPVDYPTDEEREFWHCFNKNAPPVLEMLRVVAYYIDLQKRTVYANEPALQAINVPAAKVFGYTQYNYCSEHIAPGVLDNFDYVYTTMERFDDYHYVTDSETGQIKTYKTSLDPLFNPITGNLMGVFGVAVQIYDEKIAELNNDIKNKRIITKHNPNKSNKMFGGKIETRRELLSNHSALTNEPTKSTSVMLIELTSEERNILYLLSQSKTVAEIAQWFAVVKRQNKTVTEIDATITGVLYAKFDAHSIQELLTNSSNMGLIPIFIE